MNYGILRRSAVRPTIWVLWTTPQRCCQTDLAVRGILMKHGHGTSDVQNDIEWSWGKFHLHDCIKSTSSHLHLFWRKCSGICGQTCDTMWLCMYCMYCEQVRRWIKLFRWPMTTKQHFHSSYDQHFVQAHQKTDCLPWRELPTDRIGWWEVCILTR